MENHPAFVPLLRYLRRLGGLGSALALLGWDQEVCMPPGGGAHRAAAIGDMTELLHRMSIAPELSDAIAAAESALPSIDDPRAAPFVRETRRIHERKRRIPPALAEEIARVSSEALEAWKSARARDDFAAFAPWLERIFGLRRREAEAITGGRGDPYDALLDEHEPGMTGAALDRAFAAAAPPLTALRAEIAPRSARAPAALVNGSFDPAAQEHFAREVLARMGFDFERGRIDVSTHPFCSSIGSPDDVRLTTRYSKTSFATAFFGLLHEAGHGLYEQGLDAAWAGTPLGAASSMGIHESQSRLWENTIGRSRPFWHCFFPQLQRHFPGAFDGIDERTFVRAVNRVEPSFIRVEADEVTYNLHILLRYEIERALLGGSLSFKELPSAWNERMKKYLGITPATNAQGCLQDIHWSLGMIGYFPTYFLGNLYAAQFYRAARRAIPDLESKVARGELLPLRQWLEHEIHRKGGIARPAELLESVTGSGLDPRIFIEDLSVKMREVHAA